MTTFLVERGALNVPNDRLSTYEEPLLHSAAKAVMRKPSHCS